MVKGEILTFKVLRMNVPSNVQCLFFYWFLTVEHSKLYEILILRE